MKKFYAGIGSRSTPVKMNSVISDIAIYLIGEGYTLRSGAADGADTMFEEAVYGTIPPNLSIFVKRIRKLELAEIYVPWYCFNSSTSPSTGVSAEAISFSLKFHPAPHKLNEAAQKLMGRNAYQVLGKNLSTPSDFIVCWTENGADDTSSAQILVNCGGTGQALRIAKAYDIPVYNLAAPDKGSFEAFKQWYSDHNFDIM